MIGVRIISGDGSTAVKVSPNGALVTASAKSSESVFNVLDVANTAYNFYLPKPSQQFIVTGIRAKADRDVSNTVDATVVIYTAEDIDSLTVVDSIHQEAMVRGEAFTLLPLNVLVGAGLWVNAKTTDDDIHMSVMGFYIDEAG